MVHQEWGARRNNTLKAGFFRNLGRELFSFPWLVRNYFWRNVAIISTARNLSLVQLHFNLRKP